MSIYDYDVTSEDGKSYSMEKGATLSGVEK